MTMDLHREQSQKKVVKKAQNKHPLVLQEGILRDGLELHYISQGKKLLKGYLNGRGILCCCCKKVISPTMFERHAVEHCSKKPYQHIFLPNGKSLHFYASSLKFNRQKRANVGRVSGVHPVEQTAKQCVQMDHSCDLVACVLCRSCDFNADGFTDQTSILCDQCEKEYHVGCLKKDMDIYLTELPVGNWFCSEDCGNLNTFIKFVLAIRFGPLDARNSYMQSVKKKLTGSDADSITNFDVKFYVFNGGDASEEEELLLKQAVDIYHDCFGLIIDSVSGEDFIPSMAYGEQMGSSNFSGVYSALLTVNSKVITAGMFRVFDRELAELSIVATSKANQGQGYCKVFLECFETLLASLSVEKVVVPAADDAKAMWIKKFGLKKVPPKMLTEYRQTQTSMVAFQGTTLLQMDIRRGLSIF